MPGQFFRHSGQRLQRGVLHIEAAASVNMLVNQPGDHQLIGKINPTARLLIPPRRQSRNPFSLDLNILWRQNKILIQYYSIF